MVFSGVVNYKDLYGKPCKRDWMVKVVFLIQMLPSFGGRYFWDIWLRILRLPNFNILFQLLLTSELFSCLPKVDHVIKSCKEPIHAFQSHRLFASSWHNNIFLWLTECESHKTWTPEIFMECYCVASTKPIECEITKPQTAMVTARFVTSDYQNYELGSVTTLLKDLGWKSLRIRRKVDRLSSQKGIR